MSAVIFRTTANEKLIQRKAELKAGAPKKKGGAKKYNDLKQKNIVFITTTKTLAVKRIWYFPKPVHRVDTSLVQMAMDCAISQQRDEIADIISIYIGLASFGNKIRFKELEDIIKLFVDKNIIVPRDENGKRRIPTNNLTSEKIQSLIRL